jgi:hypothetical protein
MYLIKVALKNFEQMEGVSKKIFLTYLRESILYNETHGNDEKKRNNKKKKRGGGQASTEVEAEAEIIKPEKTLLGHIGEFMEHFNPSQVSAIGDDAPPPIKVEVCHPLYVLTHVYECVLSKLYISMKHFV